MYCNGMTAEIDGLLDMDRYKIIYICTCVIDCICIKYL